MVYENYSFIIKKLSYFCETKIKTMKKIVIGLFLFASVACQQDKIAYVDNIRLMDGFNEKITTEAEYTSRTEVLNKKRDSISRAFQLEVQAFQAKAESMSQQKAQEEGALLQQRGQFIGQQLQQEEQVLQQQGQVQMDSIVSKVKKEIVSFGKANGYTFILGGGDGGSVLYGQDAKDVTDEILKLLNAKTE
jgi:outer membrane protein